MNVTNLIAIGLAAASAGCSRAAPPPSSVEVIVTPTTTLPLDPFDATWSSAPIFRAALIPQDMVEPRLLAPSTPEVAVQALTDGVRVAFRLQWVDATLDDVPMPAHFVDACAIQLPSNVQPDVPAPQMGELGRQVEIAQWRASWQAMIDGRPDTLAAAYPQATIDHYPFAAASLEANSEAQREASSRYAPARALGNHMAGPRERPVEDLIAEGPGTLAPAATADSNGRGRRTADGWSVVITRALPSGLTPGHRTQIAFAVWDGALQEVGARKMRTGWTPMLLGVQP